jgi:hypothetical protein
MPNRKHIATDGPFAGLWVRTVNALLNAGYASKNAVRDDIARGALHPHLSIRDYGIRADAEVRVWLGVESWSQQWRGEPTIVRRERSRAENGRVGQGRPEHDAI